MQEFFQLLRLRTYIRKKENALQRTLSFLIIIFIILFPILYNLVPHPLQSVPRVLSDYMH